MQVAGMNPAQEVFPAGVVRGIHRYTRGIPRLINVLCDRMMLGAYGRNLGRTDLAMLRIAARALADMATEEDLSSSCLYPALSRIRQVSANISGGGFDLIWIFIPTRPEKASSNSLKVGMR